jgi:hypothetical protein
LRKQTIDENIKQSRPCRQGKKHKMAYPKSLCAILARIDKALFLSASASSESGMNDGLRRWKPATNPAMEDLPGHDLLQTIH